MLKSLLAEGLEGDELVGFVDEMAQDADGASKFVHAFNHALITESEEPSQYANASNTFQMINDRRIENGDKLLTEGFDEGFDMLVARMPDEYKEWREKAGHDQDLFEAGPTGIRASHYRHMMDHCVTSIMVDLQCPKSPYTTESMFQVLPASRCDDNDRIRYCEKVPVTTPDFCCEIADEPARFTNEVLDRVCWERPRPCYRSVAYGLHEDLECVGARQIVQDDMEAMIADWRDETNEKERIATLFGITGCTECSSNAVGTRWNFNNSETEGYLAANDGGLWINSFIGKQYNPNPEISGGCEPAEIYRRRLKRMWERTTNWYTGKPNRCTYGNFQLFLTDEWLSPHFSQMFGEFSKEHQVVSPVACDGTERRTVPGDPEFDSTYKTSDYARECLVEWFQNEEIDGATEDGTPITIAVAPNLATAQYRADNTFLISRNWQASFATYRLDGWERLLTGKNHWHFFDKGYDFAKRIFWGYQHAVQRPWLTSRVFAFDPTLVL